VAPPWDDPMALSVYACWQSSHPTCQGGAHAGRIPATCPIPLAACPPFLELPENQNTCPWRPHHREFTGSQDPGAQARDCGPSSPWYMALWVRALSREMPSSDPVGGGRKVLRGLSELCPVAARGKVWQGPPRDPSPAVSSQSGSIVC
jgi:hypothetical protein